MTPGTLETPGPWAKDLSDSLSQNNVTWVVAFAF